MTKLFSRDGKTYRMLSPAGSYPKHLQDVMRPEARTWAQWEPVRKLFWLFVVPDGPIIWAAPEEFVELSSV